MPKSGHSLPVYRLVTFLLSLIYCSSVHPLLTESSSSMSSCCSHTPNTTTNCDLSKNQTPRPIPEKMPSFYQRKLPETWYVLELFVFFVLGICMLNNRWTHSFLPLPASLDSVAFASREGKKIFKSALENNGLKSFYNLIEQHHTQTEPAFCGISTCKYKYAYVTYFHIVKVEYIME